MAQFRPARLESRSDLSDHLAIFWLRPEQPVSFAPGQFVQLGLELEGHILHRAYSIVSAPDEPELEFLLEFVAFGTLTPKLAEKRPGDEILLYEAPAGILTLDHIAADHDLLMAGTATGIAPFISMLRFLTHERRVWKRGIRLLHEVVDQIALGPYKAECEKYDEDGLISYSSMVVTAPGEGITARVNELIEQREITPETTDVLLSGDPCMIEPVRQILLDHDWSKKQIHTERFWKLPKPKETG